MGRITDNLRRNFAGVLEGQRRAQSVEPVEQLILNGHNPAHAIYTHAINLASRFTEDATLLAPLRRAHDFLVKSEDTYMPSFPPMSPVTVSYYVAWTLFDVRFGDDRETIGDCLAGLSDLLDLAQIQLEALSNLRQSRIGIYKVLHAVQDRYRLCELPTGLEFEVLIPSGFKGRIGSTILIRLLPPLGGVPSCHIGATTPYVLVGHAESEWIEYFQRYQIVSETMGTEERLNQHFKQGVTDYYWSEYIFCGFLNYRSDAIFLTGLPDRPETQPHHENYRPGTAQIQRIEEDMAHEAVDRKDRQRPGRGNPLGQLPREVMDTPILSATGGVASPIGGRSKIGRN